MVVAEERDVLLAQLEEAKWRVRQTEKDKLDLQSSLTGVEQVGHFLVCYCISVHSALLCGPAIASSTYSGLNMSKPA